MVRVMEWHARILLEEGLATQGGLRRVRLHESDHVISIDSSSVPVVFPISFTGSRSKQLGRDQV